MNDYRQYRRTAIAEMADWEPGFDMTGVSVSDPDKANGSPKPGDKIARNPKNHEDRWLVAKAYFEDNFAPMDAYDALRTIAAQLADALREARGNYLAAMAAALEAWEEYRDH